MQSARDWYTNIQFFRHMGHSVGFLDNQREADALVFLHGFPNSALCWSRLWAELDKRYRLIALDFLGYGQSDKPTDHEYSVMDQADQVSRLLGFCGIKRAHFLAHSSGISVAQELLALKEQDDDPELPELASLCFLNGSVLPGNAPTIMEQRLVRMQAEGLDEVLTPEFLHNIMNNLAGEHYRFLPEETREVWSLLVGDSGLAVVPQLLHYIDERAQMFERWESAMETTRVPMCAMIGAEDPVWGKAQLEPIHNRMPKIETELFADVGHYPFWHAPEQVSNALLSFHTACLLKA